MASFVIPSGLQSTYHELHTATSAAVQSHPNSRACVAALLVALSTLVGCSSENTTEQPAADGGQDAGSDASEEASVGEDASPDAPGDAGTDAPLDAGPCGPPSTSAFERFPNNPIIVPGTPYPDGRVDRNVSDPSVLYDQDEGLWKMWYSASRGATFSSTDSQIVLKYAESADGLGGRSSSSPFLKHRTMTLIGMGRA